MFRNKRRTPTLIARGTTIEGTLYIENGLHLDGKIQGTVDAKGFVSIGPEGLVEGDILAEQLAVAGRVKGKVIVRGHLQMLASGHVEGDAQYGSLEVDRGGTIDGRTSRLERQESASPSRSKKGEMSLIDTVANPVGGET